MINYEGRLVWAVFSAMLAANAFVVALVGSILRLYPELTTLGKVLPWLGIALCVAWLLITVRQFGFYRYWFTWARHHESTMFGAAPSMVRDGKMFADGESVKLNGESERLNWFGRLFEFSGSSTRLSWSSSRSMLCLCSA
jgi:hypothetical protein